MPSSVSGIRKISDMRFATAHLSYRRAVLKAELIFRTPLTELEKQKFYISNLTFSRPNKLVRPIPMQAPHKQSFAIFHRPAKPVKQKKLSDF